MKKTILTAFSFLILISCAQKKAVTFNPKQVKSNPHYWQQHVDYTMDIDMNVENYQYQGKQKIVYTNNSPDDLDKVFYHLFFNAFQPDSEMDTRSRNIADPDRRVKDRISKLSPSEIGYIKVKSLKQNGKIVAHKTVGTILRVTLNEPIKAGESVTFDMVFEAQVPVQIRRSGRNNKEGVALSMAQWYPKIAAYDIEGWHADAYIGREFLGVWGDFDVTIHIDKNYMIGGSGYLQNPQEIGHGYEDASKKLKLPKGEKLSWHFKAPNVHDFTWAADPEYQHDIYKMDGIDLHFLYKKNMKEEYLQNWKDLQPKTAELMNYFSKHIGEYPYKQYSVIQGGDGGMEYAMCTLITGERKFESLFGVTSHELAHKWFQFVLATNESKHPWMDEGFTSYISDKAENEVLKIQKENPHTSAYRFYFSVVKRGIEESLAKHADRYHKNRAYSMASYSKGNLFLTQLEYIIGKENTAKTLKKYYQDFKFKHPTPNDIMRTAEKVSGVQLDWYLSEWTQTTNTIDYGIQTIVNKSITLERIGKMPMPIDVSVIYIDGTSEEFYIPLRMMLGEKPTSATVLENWAWTHPTYTFKTSKSIKSVEIDTSQMMADVDRKNNFVEAVE
ncbi:MAG: M1 family metallopeptidase [Flavobacteriaceae bacterium]|nr:M1 family metallopeptidase [Flavobacteriaceae bacterium]